MQANAAEYPVSREQRLEQESRTPLMTPARRAALDALEREFHDLLKARTADAA